VKGDLGGRGRIGLEYAILLPLCLVFLLDCYETVSFLCLYCGFVSKYYDRRGVMGTCALQFFCFGDGDLFQGLRSCFDRSHDCSMLFERSLSGNSQVAPSYYYVAHTFDSL
jgi:hypothetical protein